MRNGEYELIVAPEDYPGKKYRGRYAYEHHVVYWKKRGALPEPGQVIHHKNEDKRDNRIGNLELLPMAKHTGQHNTARKHPNPEMITRPCTWCGTPVRRRAWAKYRNQKNFYCCRSHQVSDQQTKRWNIPG